MRKQPGAPRQRRSRCRTSVAEQAATSVPVWFGTVETMTLALATRSRRNYQTGAPAANGPMRSANNGVCARICIRMGFGQWCSWAQVLCSGINHQDKAMTSSSSSDARSTGWSLFNPLLTPRRSASDGAGLPRRPDEVPTGYRDPVPRVDHDGRPDHRRKFGIRENDRSGFIHVIWNPITCDEIYRFGLRQCCALSEERRFTPRGKHRKTLRRELTAVPRLDIAK